MTNQNEDIQIHGTVASGFEPVRSLFEHNMNTLAERNTQLCIYYDGERVVDLWASADDNSQFSPNSLINVFSSGKSLEAIAMASLVGKGLLDYNNKITDYWPAFAGRGKQDLTVADLMRHEAGLAAFNVSIKPNDLRTENIKKNKIGEIIETHPQKFREGDGSKREYHAVTRGWIVNEVFRRIDPAGRTIGEFLREDISTPLDVDANIGVKQEDLDKRIPVSTLGIGFQVRQSLKPKFLGRRMEHNAFHTIGRLAKILPRMRQGTTSGSPPPFVGMVRIAFFNDPSVAMGETPSANANCSARGLAKIAAMMSQGGSFAGNEIINEKAWQSMHAAPVESDMGFMKNAFTQGGVAKFLDTSPSSSKMVRAFNEGRQGFYGWMGLGGSIFQWHPEHKIGFGYVPTSLNVIDLFNERGKSYQAEVLKCVEKIAGTSN
jgi:CubicO group peptidase (beta-lactamase class C family)